MLTPTNSLIISFPLIIVTPRYFCLGLNTKTHSPMQKKKNKKKPRNKISQHNHQLKIVSFLVLIAVTTPICLSSFNQDN